MNQNLIQLNNNCGMASDENGNLSLIGKESDSYDFEEILLKENDLENLNLRLQKSKEKLSDTKQNMIFGEIANVGLIGAEVFIYAFLHSAIPLELLIPIMAITYVPFKCFVSLMYGTRIGRHIKKKRLTTDIEKMKLELPTLEKELMEIKEKSKYKVNVSIVDETKTEIPVEEIRSEMSLPMDSYISEEHTKVRVLSLSKRR